MTAPRTSPHVLPTEFFLKLRDWLAADPALAAITRGAERVRLSSDNYPRAEGAAGTEWGRIVIVPTRTLWRIEESPYLPRAIGLLLRAEVPDLRAQGLNPALPLEDLQRAAYVRILSFAPALAHSTIHVPLYRFSHPASFPEWDEPSGTWFTSAEYRTELGATPSP